MKMKTLVALLVAAGLAVPAVSMAEDRLSLSGSMQVRGQYYDVDMGGMDDDGMWNDQRLRVQGKFSVADGVSVHFRFDATESDENSSDAVAWGGSGNKNNAAGHYVGGSAYQYSQRRADIQFDKAYLQLDMNGMTLQAGQLYFGGFGHTRQVDVVGAGFIGKYQGLTLAHVKRLDENAGNNSFATSTNNGTTTNAGDVSLTAVKYDIKTDAFTLTPMVAYNLDDNFSDYDLMLIGAAMTTNAGPVSLKAELDFLTGERGNTDLAGTQLFVDASVAASDMAKVGVMAFYALGQDGGDEQVTDMNYDGRVDWAFADWHPECYGPWASDFVMEFDVFEPAANAGVMGMSVYADINASEDLLLQFAGMYATTEDDDIADENVMTLNAAATYKLTANTKLNAHAYYVDWDEADASALQVIAGLVVGF
ncbi:MAG: hypothetical protein C0614_08330 [Desulfuromonas sp.]|nr:MAG: hypothetical protein C0614_08330 [Desulfuromonas sp.]